jgi:hypothetical protein
MEMCPDAPLTSFENSSLLVHASDTSLTFLPAKGNFSGNPTYQELQFGRSIFGVPIPPRRSIGLPTATPADSLLKSFNGSNLGFALHLGLQFLQPTCYNLRVNELLDSV